MKFEDGMLTFTVHSYFYGKYAIKYQVCDDAAWTSVGSLPSDVNILTYESQADESYCSGKTVDLTYMINDVYRTNPTNILWDRNLITTFTF